MSYQALYRVFRPQRFEDVVGQQHITKTLQNALIQEKLSHAYLFSGPRGTGKTSAAKILAKAVNCEKSPVSEPCNECFACVGITSGEISDVIEIDAASNNGVAEIRYIRDKVKLAPGAVRYKVYIIDEVHMLSEGAFNALLKTLEEPPGHVIFILATTEPHKIPLTIISRCQRFDFHRITTQTIVERMKTIIAAEGIEAEEAALVTIAKAAEGGMRDALSLLDQAISFSDYKVTEADALAVTGAVSHTFLAEVAAAMLNKDAVQCLTLIDELIKKGKEPVQFLEDVIFYFRDLLLYKHAPALETLLEKSTVDEQFKQLAENTSSDEIYYIIRLLNESQQEMKYTNHPKVFLEVALLKICNSSAQSESEIDNEQVKQLQQRIQLLEDELKLLKTNGARVETKTETAEKKVQRAKPKGAVSITKINALLAKANRQELHTLKNNWATIMDQLKREKISAHATLIDSEPVAASHDAFILSFKYAIHCQMAKENENIIESIVSRVMGKPMEMVEIPEQDWKKVREEYIRSQRQEETPKLNEDEQDPLISEAIKLFGPDLIEIKEQ